MIQDIIPRQILHAASFSFLPPDTGNTRSFTAPPPEDMAMVIEKLRTMKSNEKPR